MHRKMEIYSLFLCLFTVQYCKSQTLNDLKTLWNGLPDPVLYLPLSKQFGLNDAGPNGYAGKYSSTRVPFVNGPGGMAETAIETGTWADQQFVTIGNHAPLKFESSGGTSWTISLFSNMAMVGPIFEFDWINDITTTERAHLWMHSSDDQIWFNPMGPPGIAAACPLRDTWNYVAVRYNKTDDTFRTYCDTTLNPPGSGEPQATQKIFLGARDASSQYGCDGCKYACFAVYREVLSQSEMDNVRQMCDLWNQVVTCPAQCEEDACWPDLSQTNGYRCEKCNTGWVGTDCATRKFDKFQSLLKFKMNNIFFYSNLFFALSKWRNLFSTRHLQL